MNAKAMEPMVSVVIPTYNQSALLLETLQSVIAQSFQDCEIIVVNDGSTDDTLSRLKPHLHRIRLIDQENRGIGAARNRGLDEARGRYVALLDHDDLWASEKLATQVAFMETHPECVACIVPWAMSTDQLRRPADIDGMIDDRGVIDNPLGRQSGQDNFVVTSALMVRRDRMADIRYATERDAIEDVSFNVRLYARGAIGIAGREVLMTYRVHAENFSRNAIFYGKGIELLRRMDAQGMFAELPQARRADLERYLAGVAHMAVIFALRGGQRGAALRTYCAEAWRLMRWGHARLAIAAPFMMLAPMWLIRRRWRFEVQ